MTINVPIDATQPAAVAVGVQAYLDACPELGGARLAAQPEANGDGFDTHIYFFELTGSAVPEPWRGPLVLRIFPSPAQGERARRESDVQRFVSDAGYPAPPVLAWAGPDSPLGLPFMVMPRAAGRMMFGLLTGRPWAMGRTLGVLGEAHARLHRLPIAGAPLPYDRPLVTSRLDDLREGAARLGLDDEFAWLERNAGVVQAETPVFTHNDFHPLNVLVDEAGALTVIDWSDARIGDRHHDVARTTVLFWIAAIAANSMVERLILRALRGRMISAYLRGYRKALPIDGERLNYWQALHALHGVGLVRDLHESTDDPAIKDSSRGRVPARLANELRAYFWARARPLP